MISIPRSKYYEKNQSYGNYGYPSNPCIVCGKEVKSKKLKSVHTYWGSEIVTEEEAKKLNDPASDSGLWYIGNDCLRKNPQLKPYIQ
jgi:hypothetical protein